MKNERRRKKAASFFSVILILSILLTGTYAWKSIRQKANNKVTLATEPGARLHDDFNGSNKDVYVENYTSSENGQLVYVRIRMSEYLETGTDAGENLTDPTRDATSLITGANINDTSTWNIHILNSNTDLSGCQTTPSFHDYWTWELGGSTVYMPTFNKNNESLDADINGTWESVGAAGNRYSDYESYSVGDTEQGTAQYAPSSSTGTEVLDTSGNVLYKENNETHTAKDTQTATVITMQEWLANGAVPGKFWVWDEDGWAYWAEALQPEKATGCLLTEIAHTSKVTTDVYYAIDVVGEFTTAFDWGDKGSGTNGTGAGATGFYENGVTDNGKYLLDRIASVVTTDSGDRYVDCGNNTYQKIDETNGTLGNLFSAGPDKKPGTSDDKTNVVKLENDLTIDGTNYGSLFIGPSSSNAYWAMGNDKLLGTTDDEKIWYVGTGTFPGDPIQDSNFSFKGADTIELTGLTDGIETEANTTITNITATVKLNNVEIQNQGVSWTISGNTSSSTLFDSVTNTMTIGADEQPGTLTITITSDEDKKHAVKTVTVKVLGPDEVSITSDDVEVTEQQVVSNGKSQIFVATVKRKGNIYSNNQVNWKLTGNTKVETTLVNGVLTVAEDEPKDTILTIVATAENDVAIYKKIEVKNDDSSIFDNITSGSADTVTIDGVEFYVLEKNGDETLIWAKNSVDSCAFGSSTEWNENCAAYKNLVSWFEKTTDLKTHAVEKTIFTRKTYDGTEYNEMNCKVFLLSEADVFGTANGSETSESKEYTYAGKQLVNNSDIKRGNGNEAWLRSPYYNSRGVAYIHNGVDLDYGNYSLPRTLRPALWVKGL